MIVSNISEILVYGTLALNGISVQNCHNSDLIYNYPGQTYSVGKSNAVMKKAASVDLDKKKILHGGYIDPSIK